jgi:hypothetical protein
MKAELVSRPAIRPMVDPFARHVTYIDRRTKKPAVARHISVTGG